METKTKLKLIKPHKIKSRELLSDEDYKRAQESAKEMVALCNAEHGLYKGGHAITHSQVTKEDPLRFFVTYAGEVVCNPKIINCTKTFVNNKEGCLSYSYRSEIQVPRHNKVTVRYQSLDFGEEMIEQNLNGKQAKIFQHEIDHMDGKYIYD